MDGTYRLYACASLLKGLQVVASSFGYFVFCNLFCDVRSIYPKAVKYEFVGRRCVAYVLWLLPDTQVGVGPVGLITLYAHIIPAYIHRHMHMKTPKICQ